MTEINFQRTQITAVYAQHEITTTVFHSRAELFQYRRCAVKISLVEHFHEHKHTEFECSFNHCLHAISIEYRCDQQYTGSAGEPCLTHLITGYQKILAHNRHINTCNHS